MSNQVENMTKTISNSTIETLMNHRSVRQYTGEPIAPEMLETILQAGRMVSTSSYLQAASIIRVTDPELRTQFRQISNSMDEETYKQAQAEGKGLGHDYIETCAEFLVFCIDSHRHNRLAPESQLDWTEVGIIGAVDASLLAQNIMVAAESLGLGGVYIGSMRNDIERASNLLNIPKHVIPLFGMCLGHPTEAAKAIPQRPRFPLSVLVSENQYQPASDTVLEAYNSTVEDYYTERSNSGNPKKLDWQKQVHNTFAKPVRPHILDYFNKQGFMKR